MIIPKSTNPNYKHFQDQAHHLIDGLNPDVAWKVAPVRNKKKRGNPANAYHWCVIIKILCEETGNEAEDLHEYLLGEYVGWVTHVILGKKKLKPARRSHDMDHETFENFNEYCRMFASRELGIIIPLPGETL